MVTTIKSSDLKRKETGMNSQRGNSMKKLLLCLLVLIVVTFLVAGLSGLSPAQGPAKKEAPKTSAEAQPVRGGNIRILTSVVAPHALGYLPEWGPGEWIAALPWAERLVHWDEKGHFVSILLDSWKIDPKGKTILFHIRKGVTFSDGSPFDAESLKANLDLNLKIGRLMDADLVKTVDIVDKDSVRLTLTDVTSAAMLNYGFNVQIISTTAAEKNGKDWARTNGIGTGPFKLVDFKRDEYVKYARNDTYWRKGYPLLDSISYEYVPDAVTASMKMEAKEADMWGDVPNVKMALDLQQKGFKVNWGPGMMNVLLPNTNKPRRPDSPLLKKKVLEAIEYALDRPAIAKALGFGQYEPLTQIVPSFSPAYNPGLNLRPYDPEKAKQLLAEAGYPNGFELKLTTMAGLKDGATAVQSYLDRVGIKVTIDIADAGRYAAALFSPAGWDDLIFAASGIHPSGTDLYQHWGPRPATYRYDFIKKTPEYLAACEKALHTYEERALKKAMQDAVRKASVDSMVIPVFRSAQPYVMQPYVHTEWPKIHQIQWSSWEDWMAKH
jgi:peptide/nickel transport system substrate-binding protein